MTSRPESFRRRLAHKAALIVALGTAAWAASCASAETINFSNGECVAGGCAQTGGTTSTTSSSTGGPCMVNPACSVSFATDVFAGILDGPAGCTATGLCHGDGKGNILLETGKPHDAWQQLTGYTLLATPGPVKPYIVPCDPAASGFTCNMAIDPSDGGTNPYGTCGSPMPNGKNKLTPEQLNTIVEWIQCGAPDN
jgi:hypothetical protein